MSAIGLLEGIRVLDLGKLIPGGIATGKLADLGAEVIKVEQPPLGDYIRALPPVVDGLGYWDLTLNRNKKSIGLDLKTNEGRAIFFALLETADVVVEVSKPGAMGRLGLDYESLRAKKADLVYCSLTGFGQTGAYRTLPSHGKNIDAAAGQILIRRDAVGRPQVQASPSVAIDAGGVHAALAVMAALIQRFQTGAGQYIDVSCWDAGVSANRALATVLNFDARVQLDPFAEGAVMTGPKYNVYATQDDKVILICPVERKFWVQFCKVVGREDWSGRGRWDGPMDLGTDDPALAADLAEVLASRTLNDWMGKFIAAGVPASPVLDAEDLVNDAHAETRQMVVTSEDPRYPSVKYLRIPITVPGRQFRVGIAPPRLGEHTVDLLTELGFDVPARTRFIESGAAVSASRS